MYRLLLALAFVLISCGDNATVTGPTPSMVPPPSTEESPPSPPVSRGNMFSWADTRGLLIFAGTQASESQIRQLDSRLRALGWPTPTYNVCSETAEWEGTLWADGPTALSDKNLENLQRFLRVTAELGSQVRLNIFCTVRDNHLWMRENLTSYTTKVAIISAQYDHLSLSVANEPYHRDSYFKHNLEAMRQVRDTARMAGFGGLMGADDSLGCPDPKVCNFEYQYRSLGFLPDFHPFRSPDPGQGTLRALVEVNGLPLIISEPTCYSAWRDDPLCTADQARILGYMRRSERLGIVWFFHSTDGLQWPQKPHFDWIPQ